MNRSSRKPAGRAVDTHGDAPFGAEPPQRPGERGDQQTELRYPTTIAAFGNALYAVNARFTTPPTPDTTHRIPLERQTLLHPPYVEYAGHVFSRYMTRYERQRSGSLFQYAPLSCNVCGELFIANLLKEHRNAISCDLLHHTLAPPHVRYLVAQHKRALYG